MRRQNPRASHDRTNTVLTPAQFQALIRRRRADTLPPGRQRRYRRSAGTGRGHTYIVLTPAQFQALIRRRKVGTPSRGPRRWRWAVLASILLILILLVSIWFLLSQITHYTRPFPLTPRDSTISVTLTPGSLSHPKIFIAFAPANVSYYLMYRGGSYLSIYPYISTIYSVYEKGSHFEPIYNSRGQSMSLARLATNKTWKILIDVVGYSKSPPKDIPLFFGIPQPSRSLLSNVVEYSPPRCASTVRFVPAGSTYPLYNTPYRQVFTIFPCPERGGRVSYIAEGILHYPVESDTNGHVYGKLPSIEVGYSYEGGNILSLPYQVSVVDRYLTEFGALQRDLSGVDFSRPPESRNFLQWRAKGYADIRWSWDLINEIDRAQEYANISLVLIGVVSAAFVTLVGYILKSVIPTLRI